MDLKKMPVQEAHETATSAGQTTAVPIGVKAEAKLLDFFGNLRKLETDWDGNGALKPDERAIDDSISFARKLFFNYPGTKIEQACAGAVGEIVVELRNKEKSVEFLFYPNNKWKYVSVGGDRPPEQGVFELNNLQKIITWLNNDEA